MGDHCLGISPTHGRIYIFFEGGGVEGITFTPLRSTNCALVDQSRIQTQVLGVWGGSFTPSMCTNLQNVQNIGYYLCSVLL